jgi:SAM-dependent methyltransferase
VRLLRSPVVGILEKVHANVVFGRRVHVLARHLARVLPARASVLDVGCGDGSVAALVLDHRADLTIRGIDVLVRPVTQIPVEPFDGHSIDVPDGSFDVAMFIDVLHHTDDPRVLLREAARVARNVVIKDHLAEGFLARPTLRTMDWFGNASHGVVLPYNYWTRRQWLTAFDEVGLVIDSESTALGLYPAPASLLFDRRLHVLWRLRERPAVSCPSSERLSESEVRDDAERHQRAAHDDQRLGK